MTERNDYDSEQEQIQHSGVLPAQQGESSRAIPVVPELDQDVAAAEPVDDAPIAREPIAPEPRPYVRQRAPHRTQEAIDDLADEGISSSMYAHDSNVSIRGGAFSGREYRRSRSGMGKVQSGRYGQYLEIPKGRRSIFASRERKRRRRSLVAAFFVVALLAAVAYVIWVLIQQL